MSTTNTPQADAPIVNPDLPARAGGAAVPQASPETRATGWQLLICGRASRFSLCIIAAYFAVALVSLLPAPRNVPVLRSIPGVRAVPSFNDLVDFKYDVDQTYAPPAWSYSTDGVHRHASPAAWFGLDFQGHSVFWRTLYGARTALLITALTSVLVLSIGTVLGLTAGYFGGWVDDAITWVYSVVSTIPWLLLVIAVTYTLQQNAAVDGNAGATPGRLAAALADVFPRDIMIVVFALGLTDWVSLCRLIRGETIKLRDSDMVAAGRALGLSEARILFRHILPNVSHLIIITFTLGAVGYLQVEVVLAFLGLGVTTKPSWGRMIDDAKLALMRGVWWEVVAATAAIFVICMALTLLGDALRDALDPKTRGRA